MKRNLLRATLVLAGILATGKPLLAGDASVFEPSEQEARMSTIDFRPGEIRVLDAEAYDRTASFRTHFALWPTGMDLAAAQEQVTDMEYVGAEEPPGYLKPILLSGLIPGAGEFALGSYGRATFFFAAEIFGWWQYFRNREDGLEKRDAYERYADDHWDLNKWFVERGEPTPEDLGWTEAQTDSFVKTECFQWQSRKEDKQHFYENIGKYNCFIQGWDDFDPLVNSDYTYTRDVYRAMRSSSNHDLNQARNYLAFNIATRIISMIDSALIVKSRRKAAEEGNAQARVTWKPWAKYKMKGPMLGFTLYFQ